MGCERNSFGPDAPHSTAVLPPDRHWIATGGSVDGLKDGQTDNRIASTPPPGFGSDPFGARVASGNQRSEPEFELNFTDQDLPRGVYT